MVSHCLAARYTAYADDVSVLVTRSVEVVKVNKEIRRYEIVTGAKINRKNSVTLLLGSWKSCVLHGPFSLMEKPCKILGVWFSPDLQLVKNWSEVLEKVMAAIDLWLRRRISLKGRAEVCGLHISPWSFTIFQYFLSRAPSYLI